MNFIFLMAVVNVAIAAAFHPTFYTFFFHLLCFVHQLLLSNIFLHKYNARVSAHTSRCGCTEFIGMFYGFFVLCAHVKRKMK